MGNVIQNWASHYYVFMPNDGDNNDHNKQPAQHNNKQPAQHHNKEVGDKETDKENRNNEQNYQHKSTLNSSKELQHDTDQREGDDYEKAYDGEQLDEYESEEESNELVQGGLMKMIEIKAMYIKNASKSGMISRDVIASILLKLGIEDLAIHEYMYKYYDQDKNGLFDSYEFCAFMVATANIHSEFKNADFNLDDRISLSEISAVLEHLELPVKERTINLIMEIFDLNNDQVLNFGEFFLFYIFLRELLNVFDDFIINKHIEARHLCKLLNNPEREEVAAQELNTLSNPSIDDVTFVITKHKGKLKAMQSRRKLLSEKKHIHPSIRGLHSHEGPWEDRIFGPNDNAILPNNLKDKSNIKWCRPRQINSQSELFVNGIEVSDVIQSGLQDCWFLGALAVVAAGSPNCIHELFVAADHENGFYRCKFYKNNGWVTVDVDDRLPCYSYTLTHVLCFASCYDKREFWVPILEKAYAKLHGSYEALQHGDVCEALKDLTGGATQMLFIDQYGKDINRLWDLMLSFVQQSCLMGCAIEHHYEHECTPHVFQGLWENHAYSILNCQEVEGMRFVQLRNPWGRIEWSGDWSDGSEKWNEVKGTEAWRNKAFVENYKFEDDGTFFMCFEDFAKNFNRLYVLRRPFTEPRKIISGKWDETNSKGCHLHPYWHLNPRYSIVTSSPDTTLLINLSQHDIRKMYGVNGNEIRRQQFHENIGMYLLETPNPATMHYHGIAEHTIFTDSRDTSLEFKASAPASFVLLPCMYKPDSEELSYTISLFADKPVEFHEIPRQAEQRKAGKWSQGYLAIHESKHSGPYCMLQPGPVYLPQGQVFLLSRSKDGFIDILLVPQPEERKDMELSIKVYARKEAGFVCVLCEYFFGISMCVSLEVTADVDYIIEPITTTDNALEVDVPYELVVFSDHVSHFCEYIFQETDYVVSN